MLQERRGRLRLAPHARSGQSHLELPEDRLAPTTEATAYFTVSEALTNIAKYAEATHATIRMAREDGLLVVEVRDDGVGGANADGGSGLSGLADRLGACEGSLSVTSPPGEGTLVRAVLPLTAAGGQAPSGPA